MKQELSAYLIQGDGEVWDMPTEGLLLALDQVTQGSATEEQNVSSYAAVSGFLQALRRAMQIAKLLHSETG